MLAPASLPVLRQDLKLHPVEQDRDGRRRWLLQDPTSHRFFRLGEHAVELLPFINGRPEAQAAQVASRQLQRPVDDTDLKELGQFLRAHDLVRGDHEQQQRYAQRQEAKPSGITWLLKHYLFIRIPLANPDRWLTRHVGKLRWLGHRRTTGLMFLVLLVASWLTLRQWDSFIAGFGDLGKAAGWLTLGAALVLIKILHELGHAFVAKAKGARVPTIGLAFVVGWPILYTDTSDAWRFTRARDRVQVDAAGVATELGVAVFALLFWHILPEGTLRSICFWLATTTWIMSVLVNFNPLMRFDGYHLLADAWRKPNLEARSQAMARWQLREWLFGFKEPPPEARQRRLIIFAFSVWIYRLVLFIGIALAVYHFFFKLLGIFLFIVEIWYFVLRPIVNEVRQWFRLGRRPQFNTASIRTLVLAAGLTAVLFWPWQSHLRVPAFLTQATARIDAPLGGTVMLSVATGEVVIKGQRLAHIRSAETNHALNMAQRRLEQLNSQLSASGLNTRLLGNSPLIKAERDVQRRRVANLEAQSTIGELFSPFAGRVQTLSPDVQQGGLIGQGEPLMTLIQDNQLKLIAWVNEEDVLRLRPGQAAVFYPLAPVGDSLQVTVDTIGQHALTRLEQPAMAQNFGGPIPVREDRDGDLLPLRSLYRVQVGVPATSQVKALALAEPARRGVIRAETEARSLMSTLWRNVVGVWRRESGF